MRTRTKAVLACNAALAIAEPLVWLVMALSSGDGVLSSSGIGSLKYFTVLSNLLLGLAGLCYSVCLLRASHTGTGSSLRNSDSRDGTSVLLGVPRPIRVLKYASVVSTTLTFVVVFVLFGPAIGYGSVLSGSNFWFHLVLPVFALVEFCALEAGPPLKHRDVATALIAPLVYGIGYWLNIALNGAGTWESGNDWYGAAQWGLGPAVGIFALTMLLTWAIALLVRYANVRIAGRAHQR